MNQNRPDLPPPPPPAQYYNPSEQPGHSKAVGSLVLGICAMVTGMGIILGIISIVMAAQARKEGYVGGLATAGMVLSIISIALSVLVVACVCAIIFSVANDDSFWHWIYWW